MLSLDYTRLRIISTYLFVLSGSLVFAQDVSMIIPLGNSFIPGTLNSLGDTFNCTINCGVEATAYRNRMYNLSDDAGFNLEFAGSAWYGCSLMSDPEKLRLIKPFHEEIK